MSGTYRINGTELTIQPTSGRWIPLSPIGITGDGHPVYPSVRTFELRWNLTDQESVDQLRVFFELTRTTGTVVVDLPKFTGTIYDFYAYSGCVLYEPERGAYFVEHTTDFVMMVGNIVT